MIRFLSLFTVLAIFAMPVIAQDEAVEETAAEEKKEIEPVSDGSENLEGRLELSKEMHEIWPMRPKIEKALEVISMSLEEDKRLPFKAAMRKAIDFPALEQASIEAMADIYSEAELQAMINFYGSKEGRSVSHKLLDYEQALKPIMTQMVDKAILDVRVGE